MTSSTVGRRRDTAILLGAWVLLCLAVLGLAARHLDTPGLYYDEVIQAVPAAEFLREDGRLHRIPGAHSEWLFGGWFPVMTQKYMGALKSQLLIPTFAVFGADRVTLRLTTLAWGLLGLLLAMLWAREILGLPTALAAGALLAVDPSFLFVSRHDWGSFSLSLVCRCGGLLLLTLGWKRASPLRVAGGGILLGLGVFNKIDFATFLAGAGLALVSVARGMAFDAWRSQRRLVLSAVVGFLVGAAPMLVALGGALRAVGRLFGSQGAPEAGWAAKLEILVAMLDGSHFHRLMLAGGKFEELGAVHDAASGPFLVVFVAAAVALAARAALGARRGAVHRAEAFVLVTALLTMLAVFLTPRAVRIHHTLNVYPFPQLVVAAAAVALASTQPPRAALRALAVVALFGTIAASVHIDLRTLATLRETGGSGRWSNSVEEFAVRLADAGDRAVSLGWGFHTQLLFSTPELELSEPIWQLDLARRNGRPLLLEGGPRDVYLVPTARWAVFPFGESLLRAVRVLPEGSAIVREHADRSGETAFRSIRFARPHQLVYRGSFEVRLR